ncbi:MAG: heme-binding protein [Pseudomonadota bacterium]
MKKRWVMIAGIVGVILIASVLVGPIMSNVEQPEYEVISSHQNIEIRHYKKMIIAEVKIQGSRKEAIGDGFRLLADYIFGNNTINQALNNDGGVSVSAQQQNTQIAMTAPVQQQQQDGLWQIRFVMPVKYRLKTLPQPNDRRVTLKEIPSKRFVTIRFSGTNNDENINHYETQLMDYVNANNVMVTGSPQYAFYNPPWTLPFMRRNEIMIEIKQ